MAVIIDGMRMPEGCFECKFVAFYPSRAYCLASRGVFYEGIDIFQNSRPDWCPLRPAPEWISVKDRLPESAGYYLCLDRLPGGTRYVDIMRHCNNGKWGEYDPDYGDEVGFVYTDSVTYWMPMPELPKGGDAQ